VASSDSFPKELLFFLLNNLEKLLRKQYCYQEDTFQSVKRNYSKMKGNYFNTVETISRRSKDE
jgi:hypothetical protein